MPVSNTWKHDPNAHLDYSWPWISWLLPGETITAYTVTASNTDVHLTDITLNPETQMVTVWVDAPNRGTRILNCHVETSQGRKDDREIVLIVDNR